MSLSVGVLRLNHQPHFKDVHILVSMWTWSILVSKSCPQLHFPRSREASKEHYIKGVYTHY
ncbi:hypothetical protein OROGR_022090 [Orobanche gracilis]